MKKRIVSFFVMVCMVFSLLPMNIFAATETNSSNSLKILPYRPVASIIYNGHTYGIYNNPTEITTWEDAEEFCENLDGHLATITSSEENIALFNFIRENNYTDVYFGLYAPDGDNKSWQWVTGELLNYTAWGDGEPNKDNPNEKYTMFFKDYTHTDKYWNDGDFGVRTGGGSKAFICEWDYETGEHIEVFSDHSSFSASVGDKVTINAAIYENGVRTDTAEKMKITVSDSSIASVTVQSHWKSGYTTFFLDTKKTGTVYVTITAKDGKLFKRFPVTVTTRYPDSYTIYNVPDFKVYDNRDFTTNFYNLNGIYVDGYKKETKTDGSADVEFMAYNQRFMHGIVEIHDADDNLITAQLITKNSTRGKNIKSTVIDNSYYLFMDFASGDVLTYRQSDYTARTSISVNVPKGGYLIITNNPKKSPLLGVINGIDVGFTMYSTYTDTVKWTDSTSYKFSNELSATLVNKAVAKPSTQKMLSAEFSKIPSKLQESLQPNQFPTKKVVDSFLNNLTEILNGDDINNAIASVAVDIGCDALIDAVTDMVDVFGALDTIFTLTKITDALTAMCNFSDSFFTSQSIYIHVPNDNSAAIGRVRVNSKDLDDNTTLSIDSYDDYELEHFVDIRHRLDDVKYKDVKNITLVKDGKETQPTTPATVTIDIDDDAVQYSNLNVYRCSENGFMTKMDAKRVGNQMIFTTDHFSIYAIVEGELAEIDSDTAFETTPDAGWYFDTENSDENLKEGIIAFNSFFKYYENYNNSVETYGMYIYRFGMEDNKITLSAASVDELMGESGEFYATVEDIPYTEFESEIIAVPYVIINGEAIIGKACSYTVSEGNKELNSKGEGNNEIQ